MASGNLGWFEIPGVQSGARSIDEQLRGLDDVVAQIEGKSVLDLGCAEGMIIRHMKQHGAGRCAAYEGNPDLYRAANEFLSPMGCDVVFADLNEPQGFKREWDVVLCLAILHKLKDPQKSLHEFAAVCRDLLVIRLPIGSDGVIAWKHGKHMTCDTREVLSNLGFILQADEEGPRTERVHIWRRIPAA